MKKKWILETVLLALVIFAATLFAEEKAQTADQKTGPGQRRRTMRTKKPDARTGDPKSNLRAKSREMMIKQQTQRMQSEIDIEQKKHDKFIAKLDAIKKMAKKEKAAKTVKLTSDLIEQQNQAFQKKIEEKKTRLQEFKKKMERGPVRDLPKSQRGSRPPRDRSGQPSHEAFKKMIQERSSKTAVPAENK